MFCHAVLHELRAKCSSKDEEILQLKMLQTRSSGQNNPKGCGAGANCAMFKLGRCAYQSWHVDQGHGQTEGFATPVGSEHDGAEK